MLQISLFDSFLSHFGAEILKKSTVLSSKMTQKADFSTFSAKKSAKKSTRKINSKSTRNSTRKSIPKLAQNSRFFEVFSSRMALKWLENHPKRLKSNLELLIFQYFRIQKKPQNQLQNSSKGTVLEAQNRWFFDEIDICSFKNSSKMAKKWLKKAQNYCFFNIFGSKISSKMAVLTAQTDFLNLQGKIYYKAESQKYDTIVLNSKPHFPNRKWADFTALKLILMKLMRSIHW